MGSIPAHSDQTPHHIPRPHFPGHLYPPFHYPNLSIPPAGQVPRQPVPITYTDLSTRLAILGREYQNSQAENAKKEAVIQYLLHSKFGQGSFERQVTELENQLSSLKERNSELVKHAEYLRSQFKHALDFVFTILTPVAARSTDQSAHTTDNDNSKGSKTASVDLVDNADLIDLPQSVEGPLDAKLNRTFTSLEDEYDTMSDDDDGTGKTTTTRSHSHSFCSDSTDKSPYNHRSPREKSNGKLHEDINRTAMKVEDVHPIYINKHEAGAQGLQFSNLFIEDVCFKPRGNEHNVYRTVNICHIPSTVTMKGVLDRVRGGMVIDIKLLDTMTMTGGKTALITFLHEYAAMAYEEFAQNHPLVFSGVLAKVTIVTTPTWPIPPTLHKNIHVLGHTRCLVVHDFPRHIPLAALKRDLGDCLAVTYNGFEAITLSHDGVLTLRFSSVKLAEQASAIFNIQQRYPNCFARFVQDPCAQPLQTLLQIPQFTPHIVDETCAVPADSNDPELNLRA